MSRSERFHSKTRTSTLRLSVFAPQLNRYAIGLLALAGIIVVGCRSGKQVKDADYCAYREIALTNWCPSENRMPNSAEEVLWSEPQFAAVSASEPVVEDEGEVEGVGLPYEVTVGHSLENLIRIALTRNPEIEVARKEVQQACAKIPQVASLADPMIDFVTWPIYPNVEQQAGGRMLADIGISQEIPWAGKRESRVGQASREVNSLQNRLAAVELKIANEVKRAYADHWLATEQLKINQQDLKFLDDLMARAEVMYEGGRIGQQDILRLRSEIGLNASEKSRLISLQTQAMAELIRALNLAPAFQLTVADQGDALTWDSVPSWEEVSALATTANPELLAIWAEIQRDQWRVAESRLNYYPDLTFSAGWGAMTTRRALAPTADGIDNLTAGVSFNLPVRIAARDAALRESESQVVKGMRNWERVRDQTVRDVKQIHAELSNLESQRSQYRSEIIPPLVQALEVTVTAYEANKSDLSELINLRREILRLRSTEKSLQADWQKSRADLGLLTAEIDW